MFYARKRTILLISLFCFIPILCAENKRVIVVAQECNLENKVIDTIKEKFQECIKEYMHYDIIDTENEKLIMKEQAKQESALYDTDSTVKIGELNAPTHTLFFNINKDSSLYILTTRLTNLTTGEEIAVCSANGTENVESIYKGAGCAINLSIIKLCKQLKIKLSIDKIYDLQYGDK